MPSRDVNAVPRLAEASLRRDNWRKTCIALFASTISMEIMIPF